MTRPYRLFVATLRALRRAAQVALAPLAHARRPQGAITLILFRGFGSQRRVCVTGQVREDLGTADASSAHERKARLLQRLRTAKRLLLSREIPQAEVEIRYGATRWHTATDSNGFFFTCGSTESVRPGPMWQPYEAKLIGGAPRRVERRPRARGTVLVRPPTARRILVSDIDDTVVYTGVANKLAMLWRLFATGPHARSPFPGVATLYRALYAGVDGAQCNPIIYVSRSPWSLYPILEEFFHLHAIPVGPVLLLRDWGISYRHPFPRRAADHKRDLIDEILGLDDEIPVVLIGDSGQRDPEVYADIARRHSGRVAAIYIRDLAPGKERSRQLKDISATVLEHGSTLVAASDSVAMAADALRRGWISTLQFQDVKRDAARGDR